jgi:DNA polymerase-3 subunit epsilon
MKNLLFYDTETTGLPAWSDPSDAPHQPHLVQLAAKVVNPETREVVGAMNAIIRPDGWTISPEVSAIHGITQERAIEEGVAEQDAIEQFLGLWAPPGSYILRRVGHNESFDARIIRIALKRYYADNDTVNALWKGGDSLCTAKMSASMVNIAPTAAMQKAGRFYPKTPKLTEAYEHLIGKPMEGAHSADGDVDGCIAVYFAIQERTQHATA